MAKRVKRERAPITCAVCENLIEGEGWLCSPLCDAWELQSRFAASVGAAFRAIGRALGVN